MIIEWLAFAGLVAQAVGLLLAKAKLEDARHEKKHAEWCLEVCRETRGMLTDTNLRHVGRIKALEAELEECRQQIEGRGLA